MTSGFQSAGVDFDLLFDPYVQGTIPAATGYTITGYGDLAGRYAPLVYGTKRANVGYSAPGVSDLSNLWAAYGTATYSLPFNGQTYSHGYTVPSGATGYSTIQFISSGSSWQIIGSDPHNVGTTIASGALPANAVYVQYTWGGYVVGIGNTDAGGTVTNNASSITLISSSPYAFYTTATVGASSGSRDREYTFTVDFFNAASSNISHNVCTLIGSTDGSV